MRGGPEVRRDPAEALGRQLARYGGGPASGAEGAAPTGEWLERPRHGRLEGVPGGLPLGEQRASLLGAGARSAERRGLEEPGACGEEAGVRACTVREARC